MKSNKKILINAEAFGFGPSAAIATFYPHLNEKFNHISYIGEGHTLDLQKTLPYKCIYNTKDMNETEIINIMSSYDIFVTATDFKMATLAKQAGIKVVIYDPLTWYWETLPEIISKSDLYIAQAFYGVSDRTKKDSDQFPINTHIISPILSSERKRISHKHILVNLGGIQNPVWIDNEAYNYASIIITLLKSLIPNENLIIATNQKISDRINDDIVKCYSRSEMFEILQNTKYAIMTPGLGNIYDSAKFDLPTVWLPPVNDSQGQQLELLNRNEIVDTKIDWKDLGIYIDYKSDQNEVLKNISNAIKNINPESLKIELLKSIEVVSSLEGSKTSQLIKDFGHNGQEQVAELIGKI